MSGDSACYEAQSWIYNVDGDSAAETYLGTIYQGECATICGARGANGITMANDFAGHCWCEEGMTGTYASTYVASYLQPCAGNDAGQDKNQKWLSVSKQFKIYL